MKKFGAELARGKKKRVAVVSSDDEEDEAENVQDTFAMSPLARRYNVQVGEVVRVAFVAGNTQHNERRSKLQWKRAKHARTASSDRKKRRSRTRTKSKMTMEMKRKTQRMDSMMKTTKMRMRIRLSRAKTERMRRQTLVSRKMPQSCVS